MKINNACKVTIKHSFTLNNSEGKTITVTIVCSWDYCPEIEKEKKDGKEK